MENFSATKRGFLKKRLDLFHIPSSILHFLVLVSCALCLVSSSATAEDVTLSAFVDSKNITLDSYVRLTLKVTGVSNIAPIPLSDINGFQTQYVGPSTHIVNINGQQSTSYAFVYALYPEKTGTFTIPSVTAILDGKDYTTQPISITVTAQPPAVSPSGNSGQVNNTQQSLSDRLFLAMGTSDQMVYLNQKIPLVVKLYIAGLNVRNLEYPVVEHTGFLMDDFGKPRQYNKVIDGIAFTIVEFQTAIYPTRTGEISLGPASEKCEIVVKNSEKSGRRGSMGFFDDDFFDGFFDSYSSRPVSVKSKPLTFDVQPLPEEGRPVDFSGAVGKFTFNVTVSPKEVKVGDPVTVRMKVAGLGSLKNFELPHFKTSQNFKVYEPEVKQEDGVKTLEQVLIPQSEQATMVPQVNFSFFDTQQKKYRTISWGPVALDVKPLGKGEGFRVVGLSGQQGPKVTRRDDLGQGISFIKSRLGRVYVLGDKAYRSPLFVVFIIVTLIGWVLGIVRYQFLARLRSDQNFARRLQAPRYARSGLKNAQACLAKQDARAFYDVVFQTLQRYFAHKCHMAPGVVSAESVIQKLGRKGGQKDIEEKLKRIFEECEASRYASAAFGADHMKQTYQSVRELIDWFERKF